jgi:uncharacterized lipoprotein
MKFRIPVILALLSVAFLAACNTGSSGDKQASPTGTAENAAPTATVAQAPPADTPTTEQPTEAAQQATPTQEAAQATAEPTTAAAAPQPLVLQPVTVETNDATRQGVLANEQKLNLPAGFHVKVYAAGPKDLAECRASRSRTVRYT